MPSNKESGDAYRHSAAVKKLQQAKAQKKPLRLAFLDIDNTWSGKPADQQQVRDLLENNNYVVIQVTNRGSDLCLSSAIDPAQKTALQGLLDPDILAASLGTELLVKQATGAFQADAEYLRKLPASNRDWRAAVSQLVQRREQSNPPFTTHYFDLPVFRLEADFETHLSATQFAQRLDREATAASLHVARDNSTLIITPQGFSKENVAEHIIDALSQAVKVPRRSFHALFAGDSAADAALGLEAGKETHATFLIPGGASLAPELKLTKSEETDIVSEGVYWVPNAKRHIVIGDEAFPGTVGPRTLIAWLMRTS